jgi:ribosome-associated toxin RatA of RatAB toxin-antitoxin module
MAEVTRTVLVGHSAERMYELVDGVERYPEFLPWCSGAEMIRQGAEQARATLHITYRGVKQSFTTDNTAIPGRGIHMTLVDGPFRSLDGTWRFLPLAAEACKIEFTLHYEFSSGLLDKLVGPVFGYIAGTMVDAFLARAEKLYGSS